MKYISYPPTRESKTLSICLLNINSTFRDDIGHMKNGMFRVIFVTNVLVGDQVSQQTCLWVEADFNITSFC